MLKEGSIFIFVKKKCSWFWFINFFKFLFYVLFKGNLWFFEIVILFGKITCFSFKVCRNFSWFLCFSTCSSLIEFCNCLIIWICQLTTNKKLVENWTIYIALVHVQHCNCYHVLTSCYWHHFQDISINMKLSPVYALHKCFGLTVLHMYMYQYIALLYSIDTWSNIVFPLSCRFMCGWMPW